MIRVGREGKKRFRVNGDNEDLTWIHVYIILSLTLATSLAVNSVGGNLTQGIKLYTF